MHKNPVCVPVCVVVIVEKGTRGIRLLFVCCLVQIQCVKKPRRRVRGHQAGFKSGCTSPRCAAWRLKQWRADSSPALAPGRCNNKDKLINTQTHAHTHNPIICCNPNRSESLSGVADFIDEPRKQGGALIAEGGTEWGVGWRGASLSSSIAMPTTSSAAPSSPCQKAVIELTFQSGSFNEALRPASKAGTNTHSIYSTVWRVCPPSTAGETHSITTTAPSINHGQETGRLLEY